MSELINDDIRKEINHAKSLQVKGKLTAAMEKYRSIASFMLRDHGMVDDSEHNAIVEHQLASIHAINKNDQASRAWFQSALASARKPMTKAKTLRDWANFELLAGNIDEATRLIDSSLSKLDHAEAQGKLSLNDFRIEKKVTRGFRSRIAIAVDSTNGQLHVAKLRALDIRLEQEISSRSEEDEYVNDLIVYRLANMGWIIDSTDNPIDKEAYVRKAIQLSGEIENMQKLREYQALLIGGDILRSSYITSRRTFGFGGNAIKAVMRRIL